MRKKKGKDKTVEVTASRRIVIGGHPITHYTLHFNKVGGVSWA